MQARFVLTAALAAGAVTPAFAGVTYTSQTRTIEALAGLDFSTSGVVAAPDFGLFDEHVEVTGHNPDMEPDSHGEASQRSTLTDTGITLSGSCTGYDGYGFGGAGHGYGLSNLDVTFSYDGADTTWNVLAHGLIGRISTINVKFERLSPAPAILAQWHGFTSSSPPWSGSGSLTGGSYRLQIDVVGGWSGTSTGSGGGPYDVTLTIPAPAAPAAFALMGVGLRRRRRADGQHPCSYRFRNSR